MKAASHLGGCDPAAASVDAGEVAFSRRRLLMAFGVAAAVPYSATAVVTPDGRCIEALSLALAAVEASLQEAYARGDCETCNHVDLHELVWSRPTRGALWPQRAGDVSVAVGQLARHFGTGLSHSVGGILLCGSTRQQARRGFAALRALMPGAAYVLASQYPRSLRDRGSGVLLLAWDKS